MARQFSDNSVRSPLRTILILLGRELREALASRWFLLYSLAFAALGLGVSYVSATSLGGSGLAGFGRTSAGLINLVLFIVPLMALTAGAGSVAGDCERGMLAYMLSQPVRRSEFLLGKYFALAIALTTSICLGFGASALVLGIQKSGTHPGPFLFLVALADALAMGMLSIGILISVSCRRTAVAIGVAVFAWLGLVFATDMGLMAGTLSANLSIEALFKLAVISPLQAFKMWSLHGVDASLDVLGPAGLYAQTVYGNSVQWIFAAVLAAWAIIPLALAMLVFKRRTPL